MRVRFSDCVLDTDTRVLFRGEKAAHLPPTAFRLLELLVENRPEALSKDQIHESVWPGTFVSEATLASAISDIRIAIGDTGKKTRFIRTVHGFGYAFSGQVEQMRPEALESNPRVQFRLIWEDRETALSEGGEPVRPGSSHGCLDRFDEHLSSSRPSFHQRNGCHARGSRQQERYVPPRAAHYRTPRAQGSRRDKTRRRGDHLSTVIHRRNDKDREALKG